MYSQGEKLPGTNLTGLGVGLALVRQLVELHGGSASASSAGLHKGSEFVVRLPIPQELPDPGQGANLPAESADRPPQIRKVMIVDDHRDAADALAALLESFGYEVATCYDGLAALETARTYRPQAVILDIGLPGMSGYEVARRLREALPDARLIALSGWLFDEHLDQAHQAGFDHYLVKPVQFGQLQQLLAERKSRP
jgi:CheY-like chemotaxis protein